MSKLLEKPATKVGSEEARGAPKKHLCFWFVPPGSARAKRVSCPVSALVGGVLVSAFVVALVGFALGDYAKIQVNRARNYIHVLSLTRDRANLIKANEDLQKKLETIASSSGRKESIEQGLKARLNELAAVVGALKSIDSTIETPNLSPTLSPSTLSEPLTAPGARARFSQDGIGGAEIECEGNPGGCVSLGLADSELKLEPSSYTDDDYKKADNNVPAPLTSFDGLERYDTAPQLAEALDHYIELLKNLPVSAPAFGRVSSGFGFRRSPFSGGISAHEGIDFSLPAGSHIFATGEGIVREVRWNPTYGLVVDIEHSPRITTRYAHLSKAFVSEGERVCRGETIALSGSTGRATGPHLHYEVLVDGKARNPDKLLQTGVKLAALF